MLVEWIAAQTGTGWGKIYRTKVLAFPGVVLLLD